MIFIDAYKENYIEYYKLAMQGQSSNGFILADNSMCALLYDATDDRSKKLHQFNQYVKNDQNVEQVVLTIREGITFIKPIKTLVNCFSFMQPVSVRISINKKIFIIKIKNDKLFNMKDQIAFES